MSQRTNRFDRIREPRERSPSQREGGHRRSRSTNDDFSTTIDPSYPGGRRRQYRQDRAQDFEERKQRNRRSRSPRADRRQGRRDDLDNPRRSTISVLTQTEEATAEEKAHAAKKAAMEAAFKDELVCGICHDTIQHPHTTECGHNFCGNCLFKYFEHILDKHIEKNPNYSARPEVLMKCLRSLNELRDIILWTNYKVARSAIIGGYNIIEHPLYTCPSCRRPVTVAPFPNTTIRNLLTACAEGGVVTTDDTNWVVTPEVWNAFFLRFVDERRGDH